MARKKKSETSKTQSTATDSSVETQNTKEVTQPVRYVKKAVLVGYDKYGNPSFVHKEVPEYE